MNELDKKMTYKKDCRHCVNVGEDIEGGTNELFCQILSEPDEPELDPKQAQTCDFYKFDNDYGLYHHYIPEPKCIYLEDNKCIVDLLNDIEYCESCPGKGRFARLSFNEC